MSIWMQKYFEFHLPHYEIQQLSPHQQTLSNRVAKYLKEMYRNFICKDTNFLKIRVNSTLNGFRISFTFLDEPYLTSLLSIEINHLFNKITQYKDQLKSKDVFFGSDIFQINRPKILKLLSQPLLKIGQNSNFASRQRGKCYELRK